MIWQQGDDGRDHDDNKDESDVAFPIYRRAQILFFSRHFKKKQFPYSNGQEQL